MDVEMSNSLRVTRRALFGRSASGIGAVALASLVAKDRVAQATPPPGGALNPFAPRAKRIIYLFQNGAPSHVDLFDYKPKLKEMHGQQIPDSVQQGKRLSTMTSGQKARPCLGAISEFKKYG